MGLASEQVWPAETQEIWSRETSHQAGVLGGGGGQHDGAGVHQLHGHGVISGDEGDLSREIVAGVQSHLEAIDQQGGPDGPVGLQCVARGVAVDGPGHRQGGVRVVVHLVVRGGIIVAVLVPAARIRRVHQPVRVVVHAVGALGVGGEYYGRLGHAAARNLQLGDGLHQGILPGDRVQERLIGPAVGLDAHQVRAFVNGQIAGVGFVAGVHAGLDVQTGSEADQGDHHPIHPPAGAVGRGGDLAVRAGKGPGHVIAAGGVTAGGQGHREQCHREQRGTARQNQ